MITLGVETATMQGGVAIADGEGSILAELGLNVRNKNTHSERLLPGLQYLLEQTGIEIGEIGLLAVSSGPGSFTGLRVGLGIVKGIAYAFPEKKVVAVPTLEALAWRLPFSLAPVCPLLDARKGELYGGVFMWRDDGFCRLVPESVLPPDRWVRIAADLCGAGTCKETPQRRDKIILMGEGARIYREQFSAGLGEKAVFAPPEVMSPSAASVAGLGARMAMENRFADPSALVPFYIRKSEAELKWQLKS
ncbi:MAG: tRNA (adenosine(37)-N6)-threonylcarbamoyltransferase complex dimerization subunit type 1 TsaB [Nitrospiraceae bacterium]|nr:tRNA (adenosine(37)-N6)-threonylcarbamoyltransferase complex dimerization subunit type 1 TsaB [Nitrospiraceae bacterium]